MLYPVYSIKLNFPFYLFIKDWISCNFPMLMNESNMTTSKENSRGILRYLLSLSVPSARVGFLLQLKDEVHRLLEAAPGRERVCEWHGFSVFWIPCGINIKPPYYDHKHWWKPWFQSFPYLRYLPLDQTKSLHNSRQQALTHTRSFTQMKILL